MALLTAFFRRKFFAQACLCLAVLVHCGVCVAANGSSHLSEYDLKAVFLLNFTRFVDWPVDESNPNRPFIIGIIGEDPFGPRLDSIVKDEHLGARPILVRRLGDISEVSRVDALFISKSEKGRLAKILDAVRSAPILTVSDLPEFAEAGGIIGLVTENSKIRLHINVDVSREAKLVLSAKLLRPAMIVSSRRRSFFDSESGIGKNRLYTHQAILYPLNHYARSVH